MSKPMTDYINYKYAYEETTRPLTMADVNQIIKRICIIEQEMGAGFSTSAVMCRSDSS